MRVSVNRQLTGAELSKRSLKRLYKRDHGRLFNGPQTLGSQRNQVEKSIASVDP